jgi:hypothetical protein
MKSGNRPKRDKKKPKLSKPLRRKIHLGGEVWTYDITRSGLRIRTPSGDDTRNISHYKFTGGSIVDEPRGEILPSDVVGYIRREFLKTDPEWKYQYYHEHLRFAEKYEIDLLKTTTRKLKAMIAEQKKQDQRDKDALERRQAHLVMENLDLLLQLTHHQLTSCSDEKPVYRGMIPEWGARRVECTRCYLLYIKEKGKWDPNFKLHLAVLAKPKTKPKQCIPEKSPIKA